MLSMLKTVRPQIVLFKILQMFPLQKTIRFYKLFEAKMYITRPWYSGLILRKKVCFFLTKDKFLSMSIEKKEIMDLVV